MSFYHNLRHRLKGIIVTIPLYRSSICFHISLDTFLVSVNDIVISFAAKLSPTNELWTQNDQWIVPSLTIAVWIPVWLLADHDHRDRYIHSMPTRFHALNDTDPCEYIIIIPVLWKSERQVKKGETVSPPHNIYVRPFFTALALSFNTNHSEDEWICVSNDDSKSSSVLYVRSFC